MSEPLRIALVGSTGLVGRQVIEAVTGREDVRLAAIARREVPLPQGARMEQFVADPEHWGEIFASVKPKAVICALGTTWKRAGRDEANFRKVDYDLVMASAEAAKQQGVDRFVVVTSVGAQLLSKSLYLRVKAEVERDLAKLHFRRLDILRPGLLIGKRVDDWRPLEAISQMASPLFNLILPKPLRDIGSIAGDDVAKGALMLAVRRVGGRYVHSNDAIRQAARDWEKGAEGNKE